MGAVMEPRIQYAKAADGVSIAYWTLGEGKPLVFMPFIPSHAQLSWQFPELRRIYERLAEGRKLVSYDSRGTGLSDRDVADYSLDAYLLDLEAVVHRLELRSFALSGITYTGMPAIAYAARHPERVTCLMLWASFARGADVLASPASQAVGGLLDGDWALYTETMSHYLYRFTDADQGQRYAAYYRECVTQEALREARRQMGKSDVSDALTQVRSPTLVLQPRNNPLVPIDLGRHLASRIPDAQLTVVEGANLGFSTDTLDAVLPVVNEFLGEGEEAAAGAAPSGLVTILFTDVEGSTALTQRLGDAKARDLLREHERIVREALKAHAGSELKTTGDGFMASFSSATRALESAIAMQRAFAAHNESAEEPILVRVGMNAGEPIAEDEDLFGTAVIEAARIAAAAKGGEILVSNVVRELAKGKDFLFADRGEVALKGFDEPVRLFEVRWREGV
jgi:class 3 adenylate cyclase